MSGEHYPKTKTEAGTLCVCGEFLDALGLCPVEVEQPRCPRSPSPGTRCELPDGHEGNHRKGTFTWTDDDQRNILKGYRLD